MLLVPSSEACFLPKLSEDKMLLLKIKCCYPRGPCCVRWVKSSIRSCNDAVNASHMIHHDDVISWKCFPHHWILCEANPPMIGGFSSQRVNDAELWFCFRYSQKAVEQSICQWFETPWYACCFLTDTRQRFQKECAQIHPLCTLSPRQLSILQKYNNEGLFVLRSIVKFALLCMLFP